RSQGVMRYATGQTIGELSDLPRAARAPRPLCPRRPALPRSVQVGGDLVRGEIRPRVSFGRRTAEASNDPAVERVDSGGRGPPPIGACYRRAGSNAATFGVPQPVARS